jgi:uncharacterized membrane protein YfcA
MFIAGYIASILIGISLGLIGGGGSILTVPVLFYLFKVDPLLATVYSLFVVGISSLIGAFQKNKDGLIEFKTAVLFGTPSILTVFITRKLIVPLIPDSLGAINGFEISKGFLMMLFFASLMIAASFSMIRTKKRQDKTEQGQKNYIKIAIQGLFVGMITGLVGAGGGFLIIPALLLLCHLPMKKAVGTALLIIAVNSLLGFSVDFYSGVKIDWTLLLSVTSLAIGGIFIGNMLSKKIDGNQLKKGFGWFVLSMGVYIILELLLHH